jgi:ribonuclease M5
LNNEKIKISLPIIVEGRYDKSTLASVFDATIITTGGFSVFNSKEKQTLIRKLAERGGVILLTDSDAGGRQIRSFLLGILPKEKIFNVYVPEIKGKEKRKSSPSKAGLLGVEGMEREVLVKALSPFIKSELNEEKKSTRPVTKLDFYNDGLTGKDGSQDRRASLARSLDLPHDMTANALIEAINLLYSYEIYREKIEAQK